MKGIPSEQRSMRTIAKVGGLVGKVMEIDESTRFNKEYVRVRIACCDVSKVPKTAESTLKLFLHDFHFEREFLNEGGERTLSSGIKVVDKDHQPMPKRHKSDDTLGQSSNTQGNKSNSKFSRYDNGQNVDKGEVFMIIHLLAMMLPRGQS